MKKLGFTLMEVLIAVAIIAIIAVLVAPTLSNIMPNRDKIKILKYHELLDQAISELISAEGIYYSVDNNLNGVSDCTGLNCTESPLLPPYNNIKFSGDYKFQNLVSDKLGLIYGRYTDGSVWEFDNETRSITINLYNEDGCGTYSNNCTTPNEFAFDIDVWGNVSGGDALTKAYLETPERTGDKAADLARANELLE